MSDAVLCEGLWKTYQRHRPVGVKSLLLGAGPPVDTRFAREWALSDVGFHVPRGRSFGSAACTSRRASSMNAIGMMPVNTQRGSGMSRALVPSVIKRSTNSALP